MQLLEGIYKRADHGIPRVVFDFREPPRCEELGDVVGSLVDFVAEEDCAPPQVGILKDRDDKMNDYFVIPSAAGPKSCYSVIPNHQFEIVITELVLLQQRLYEEQLDRFYRLMRQKLA